MSQAAFEQIKPFLTSENIDVEVKKKSLRLSLKLDNSEFSPDMHAIFSVLYIEGSISFSLCYKAPNIGNCTSADYFKSPINGEDLFKELLVDHNDSDSVKYYPDNVFNYRSAYHKQEDDFEILVKAINELFWNSNENKKHRKPS